MKWIGMSVFVLFSTLGFSMDVSFEAGNEFSITEMSGRMIVNCSENSLESSVTHFCHTNFLSPAQRSKLKVLSGSVKANKVIVTAYREDGTSRRKKSNFNSDKGESTKKFNLWLASMIQRPLLKKGQNRIVFQFFNDKSLVEEGEFYVNVAQGEQRKCPTGVIWSSSRSDCLNPGMLCSQYFRQYNFCR